MTTGKPHAHWIALLGLGHSLNELDAGRINGLHEYRITKQIIQPSQAGQ
ncbi:hypothetical protein [Paraburkholderia strydomiana]|nr:hypothetical protein [Paraburkholderia strydomiana]MBT2795011.1 hypothetical protein [Paraburkholderia strydomiana]